MCGGIGAPHYALRGDRNDESVISIYRMTFFCPVLKDSLELSSVVAHLPARSLSVLSMEDRLCPSEQTGLVNAELGKQQMLLVFFVVFFFLFECLLPTAVLCWSRLFRKLLLLCSYFCSSASKKNILCDSRT